MTKLPALILVALAAAAPLGAQSGPEDPALATARAALEKYQDPIVAVHDGYFSTLACINFPQAGTDGQMQYAAGAMGVHFLNLATVGQPLDPTRPQVLIYEPVGDRLRLVAAEWFVPVQASATAPTLFGRTFDGPMEGHSPIMPAELHHWDLHVWLWKPNPAGMFSPTNAAVRCPRRGYTYNEQPTRMVGHH